MVKNYLKFTILILLFSFCGADEGVSEVIEIPINEENEETTTTSVVVDTTTSTTTTTTSPTCAPDSNTGVNFENNINVQKFLNQYGFNAGDEDGYFGQQTTNAIRDFQAYVGLKPDGDIGPNTIDKMKNFTGCEERVNDYNSTVNTDTTTTTVVTDTTTTTVVTDTTTTTVIPITSTEITSNYGIIPSISLSTNETISLFKGIENSNSICGTPYLGTLSTGVLNQYSNGLVPEALSISNGIYSQSSNATEILEESSSEIKIRIIGDGSTNFNFYFIPPYSSKLTNIKPNSISSALNLTEATFSLSGLSSGVWFYSFAESGDGTVVKATGNREFLVGSSSPQEVSSHSGISKVLVTSKTVSSSGSYENISSGLGVSTTDKVNIVYITDGILDNRLDTTNEITVNDSIIQLSNESQASVSEILLIGSELIKVVAKDGNNFTVERGFLNTEIKAYAVGNTVQAIKNLNQETKISDFAYAIFRNETGMKFQVPLGSELTTNEFNFTNCPYDRYSLEQITTFSWRSSGSSTTSNTTTKDMINPLFDKAFVVNSNGKSYTPLSINSSDLVSGEFLNTGPKGIVVNSGDQVSFNFDGIVDGSSKPEFVKIKFQLVPDTGSTKKSKSKEIYLPVDNENYNFNLKIEKVVSTVSNLSNTWENGYKYIFESITLYDSSTAVEIVNNGKIIYDYTSQQENHDVYYLDQFSFVIKGD